MNTVIVDNKVIFSNNKTYFVLWRQKSGRPIPVGKGSHFTPSQRISHNKKKVEALEKKRQIATPEEKTVIDGEISRRSDMIKELSGKKVIQDDKAPSIQSASKKQRDAETKYAQMEQEITGLEKEKGVIATKMFNAKDSNERRQFKHEYDVLIAKIDDKEKGLAQQRQVLSAIPHNVSQYRDFKNTKEMDDWGTAHFRGYKGSKLSEAEETSISLYMGKSYKIMNRKLRKEQPLSSSMKKDVDNMDSAMNKTTPLSQNIVTYRGTTNAAFGLKKSADITQSNVVGTIVTDKGFGSSSLNKEHAAGFGQNILRIHASKGKRGIYVDQVATAFAGTENEWIFPRGTKYKILSAKKEGAKTFLDAEIMD